jgi:succinyl-CoA synthetase beta subunit
MIEITKGSQLLFGFRGAPIADLEALIDTLVRVGWLAVDLADRIEVLDINPLLIMPEGRGVAAVDALIELKKGS